VCWLALRSWQIAEVEILPRVEVSSSAKEVILEAIELHDYRDLRLVRSNEALLLREAEQIDFLGMIGMARKFAWGPNDLAVCTRRILAKRQVIEERFSLPMPRNWRGFAWSEWHRHYTGWTGKVRDF